MRRWGSQRALGLSEAEGGAPGAPMVAVQLPAGLQKVLPQGPAGAEALKAQLRNQHRYVGLLVHYVLVIASCKENTLCEPVNPGCKVPAASSSLTAPGT